jgi:hypothetical protein
MSRHHHNAKFWHGYVPILDNRFSLPAIIICDLVLSLPASFQALLL